MYTFGIFIFLPCSIISILAAKERRHVPTPEEKLRKAQSPKGIRNLLKTLKGFSLMFYFLMFTQLVAWMGLWPCWTYVSDWMGESIFNVCSYTNIIFIFNIIIG